MSPSDTPHRTKRMLSSGFTLAVTIGGIIGLGILRTPGEVVAVAEINTAVYAAIMVAVSWPAYRVLMHRGLNRLNTEPSGGEHE